MASRGVPHHSARSSLSRQSRDGGEDDVSVLPPPPPGTAGAEAAAGVVGEDAGTGVASGGGERTRRTRTATMSMMATPDDEIDGTFTVDAYRGGGGVEGGRGTAGEEGARRTAGDGGGGMGQYRGPDRSRRADGGNDDIGDNGGDGDGRQHWGEEDTKGEDSDDQSDEEKDDGGSSVHPPREGSSRGVSYGLHPGRRWTSEASGGHADGVGAREPGGVTRRRRRWRSRGAEGRHGGAGGRPGTKKEKEANRLRCTRGYQQHLERRLELTQVGRDFRRCFVRWKRRGVARPYRSVVGGVSLVETGGWWLGPIDALWVRGCLPCALESRLEVSRRLSADIYSDAEVSC